MSVIHLCRVDAGPCAVAPAAAGKTQGGQSCNFVSSDEINGNHPKKKEKQVYVFIFYLILPPGMLTTVAFRACLAAKAVSCLGLMDSRENKNERKYFTHDTFIER